MYYYGVRRVWAYLLAMIFGFSPVAPGLLAKDNPDVPACCRRLGAHHCAFLAMQLPLGPALKGVCDDYGRSPAVLAPPESIKRAVLKAPPAVVAVVASYHSPATQTVARYCLSFSRSHHKRGPPSLSL
jgi:hypothetical protein